MNKELSKAFTLIELLTVITIVGILSGLSIVSFGGVAQKALTAKYQIFSNSLKDSLLMNIVLQLKFDEGTGQTAKDTWGTNDFTLGNDATVEASDPTWISNDCISEKCLNFNKNPGQFLAGNNNIQLDFRNGITVEAFFKPTSITTNGAAIFDSGTDAPDYYEFSLFYRGDGGIGFYLYDGLVDAFSDNRNDLKLIGSWHHVVYTYDYNANNIVCYLDSKILAPTNYYYSDDKEQQLNYPITIGSYLTGDGNFFDGKIDTIRFYKSVLSTSKIRENYYSGLGKLFAHNGISSQQYSGKISEIN